MNDMLNWAQGWWIGTAVGGGVVLLLASWMAKRAKSPVAVQRLGEFGILAALLVAALRLGPTWLHVPDPRPVPKSAPPVVAATPRTVTVPDAHLTPAPVDLAWMPVGINDVVRDVPPIYQQLPAPTPSYGPSTTLASEVQAPVEEPPSFDFSSLVNSLLLAYAAVAGLLLTRWLLGQWALARLLVQGRSAPEPVQQVFDRIAQQTGQTEARLLVSHRVPVPMCCGLRTPTVVIPRSLVLRNDPAVWRWVFAHELTHLARRDTWSTWAMGLTQVMYFYVPWFWWLKRQIQLSQEFVADAAAAAQGPWADEYAQFLVSLAHCPAAPQGATGVLGKTSDLYRRVTMVLQPKTGGSHSRRQLVSGVACLLASAVLLAGLGVQAATPEGDKKEGNGVIEVKPEVRVEVIAVDDDAKKDGDKKDEKKDVIRKRIITGHGVGGIDKAEIEKKIRAALEKAKLSSEELEKVMKEVHKSLEQAKIAVALAPMAGPHVAGDALKHLEMLRENPAVFQWQGEKGAPGALVGKIAGWPAQGRLGIVAEKPSVVLIEQLDLPKDHGLVILEVRKDSAADKAGMQANDIILKIAGKQVPNDTIKFIELLDGVSSDKEVEAIVLRKGKKEAIGGIKLKEKAKATDGEREFRFKLADADDEKPAKGSGNKSEKRSNKSVSVSINDGQFKATEKDGDSTLVVTGTVENKKVSVTGVSIDEPGFSGKFDSVEEVPSKYRARVKKLISNSGDSPIRFESHKE